MRFKYILNNLFAGMSDIFSLILTITKVSIGI